ncbi:ABC transporter substrate-binding protein [Pseudoalteromonas ulvae]|uniref:Glycine/betaine ABC transporter substrate-binding protein n=1 Tax=Pseudoalteromonas ulvae TaxID=107327 RepID=A0A2D0A0F8_PSEDV|nr:ABC transporter substrate-binding protein [Pseudoalteromonas ulvae]OUL56165.1 glycine/betaine ABC transporter substrate-binding protein [Pseudoalteromonas ulvae]
MNSAKVISVCFMLYAISWISGVFAGATPAKKAPSTVIIAMNEWASQRVLSKAIGLMISGMGEQVEYQDISVAHQWGALRQGFVHIQVEVWQSSVTDVLVKALADKWFDDLGLHNAKGREDWWFPAYVLKLCPDLPDWRALNQCIEVFADAARADEGVYRTGPWNPHDADLIRALKLQYRIERYSGSQPLWQALKAAVTKQEPILLLNWTPNWTDVRVQGQFVEFPEYEPACELVEAWGLNKNMAYDCGKPRQSQLKKVAWSGLKKQSLCAYQLVQNMQFSSEMIANASALVVADGHAENKAAQLWLAMYANEAQQWIPKTCLAP